MTGVAPVIGVLALQGDVREHLRALESVGARGVRVRRPTELSGLDGIVLPGGESTTMVTLATTFDLMVPLREAVRGGLPAYGSCAGMILLARELVDGTAGQATVGGMDTLVRRNAFGRQVDSFEADVEVRGISGPFHAVFIRAPWVEQAGPDVDVLATVRVPAADGSRTDRIVAVSQGRLLATSFHPELSGDARVHALFVAMVEEQS